MASEVVWVPTCCGRVMRYVTYGGQQGEPCAALSCGQCGKHITLEPQPITSLDTLGTNARVLSVVGAPKPPAEERHPHVVSAGLDDPTL
jgi:hypothetical protein